MLKGFIRFFTLSGRLTLLEVSTNKTRSFIISFGILLGVGGLLSMMSILRGFRAQTDKVMEEMGGMLVITVSSRQAETDLEKLEFSRSPGLRAAQVQEAARSIPGIQNVFPMGEGPGHNLYSGGERGHASIKAVSDGYMEEYNYTVSQGRILTSEDFREGKRVAVIGARSADRLFRDKDPIGQKVRLNHLLFTIVGVIGGKSQFMDTRSREFIYPYPIYLDQYAGHGQRISTIDVKVKDAASLEPVRQQLEAALTDAHRGVQDFEAELNSEKLEEQRKSNFVLSLLLGGIASISLITGGVSIANIMFASIGERIREIGIRKSLGARRNDIFFQFLTEAVILSSLGGILGLMLGSIPLLLPPGTLFFTPALTFFDYVLSGGASFIIGVVSGIFPALYAARMQPIDALGYV